MKKGYTLSTNEVAIIIKPKYTKGDTVGVDVGLVIGKNVGKDEEMGRVAVMSAINMAASIAYLMHTQTLRKNSHTFVRKY